MRPPLKGVVCHHNTCVTRKSFRSKLQEFETVMIKKKSSNIGGTTRCRTLANYSSPRSKRQPLDVVPTGGVLAGELFGKDTNRSYNFIAFLFLL